jgi:hypothetical protein
VTGGVSGSPLGGRTCPSNILSFALELCARVYADHRREGAYSINTSEHSLLDGVQ